MNYSKHTHPLMSVLTNIYKSGGVKCNILSGLCCDIKRLSVPVWMRKVAFLVSVLICLCACGKATLIESYEPETEPYQPETESYTESRTDSVETVETSSGIQLEEWGDDDDLYIP